jgi:predicted ester cyclase
MPTDVETRTLEANKAVIRRYKTGILNQRELDALDEVVGEDYLDHAAFPHQGRGRDGLKTRIATLWDALDPQWTIHDMMAEGDKVVIRWSHTGTHRGEFLGLAPTGRPFTLGGIDIYRLRDGFMVEHWNVVDILRLVAGGEPAGRGQPPGAR